MRSILPIFKTAVAFFICLALIGKAHGQAGTLDESFGDNGIVREMTGTVDQYTYAIAIQKDQKIVCAGILADSVSEIFLLRYNSNGSADSSFGTNGRVVTSLDSNASCKAMTLQPDGKILITGYNGVDLLVIRYETNGSIDSSFGTNGIVLTSFGNNAVGASIMTDDSNSIFVSGSINDDDIALLKYKSNGSLDRSFGRNGKVSTDVGNLANEGVSIRMQKDNKIIVADKNFLLVRYNAEGDLDSSFGKNGVTETNIANTATSMAIQNDGKMILGGNSFSSGFALARFNPDGSLDTTFGTNGLTTTNIYDNSIITSINIESDQKIIASGTAYVSFFGQFAVARYKTNGALDSTFGVQGIAYPPTASRYSVNYASAIQTDQKILVGGNAWSYEPKTSIIFRYNNDVVLPLSLLSITATAQANSVLIKWQVSNESYVNYFSVERSGSSNKNFLEISKVYGKGNSLPMQSYATTDSRPQQGWNYYRLKQVDNDGKFKYSSVVPVFFDVNATIVLCPNPTTGFIYVSGLKEGEKADLFLRDMHGNKLSIANTTQSTYQFNLTNLSSGIYYLTILQAGRTVHRKFVLQQ